MVSQARVEFSDLNLVFYFTSHKLCILSLKCHIILRNVYISTISILFGLHLSEWGLAQVLRILLIERAKTKLTPSQTLTAYEPQAHLTALVPIDNHGLRLFN